MEDILVQTEPGTSRTPREVFQPLPPCARARKFKEFSPHVCPCMRARNVDKMGDHTYTAYICTYMYIQHHLYYYIAPFKPEYQRQILVVYWYLGPLSL